MSQDTVVAAAACMLCAMVAAVALLLLGNSAAGGKKSRDGGGAKARARTRSRVGSPPKSTATAAAATKGAEAEVSGPHKGQTWTVQATYYGPDKIHGIHGGNDNIFEHIPAGQYTAGQLRQIGSHFCAMTEKFLKKGFMGKVLRVQGSKATLDVVVVDMLPDRNDGKGVEIDIHDQADWLKLGGDESVGIQTVTFSVVGEASIPVPDNSPWQPKKFGF